MKLLSSFMVISVLYLNTYCSSTIDVSQPGNRFIPVAIINHLSEEIRHLIETGDVEKGVPVLDPYVFETQRLNVAGDIFNADINITNGKISGLGSYHLKSFNLTKGEISIDLEINIPHLEFVAEHYDLLGNIYEALPLRGQGELYFKVQNIMLWSKVYMKQSADGESILLEKIENSHFSIQQIISRTQFDNNIDGIISSMVEDLLANYLTRFNTYITETYKETLIQLLNETCEKYDTWKIITLLSKYLRQ